MSRSKKNEKIAATQLPPTSAVQALPQPPRELPEPRDMVEYLGLAAEVAESVVYVRNSRWPGAAEDFPHEPALRTCDKYFREAKGGPLYIDEPVTRADVAACRRKATALAARGFRYVYIDRGPSGLDPSVESVLAQLGGERGVA